jgi:putative cell wall-binding protein
MSVTATSRSRWLGLTMVAVLGACAAFVSPAAGAPAAATEPPALSMDVDTDGQPAPSPQAVPEPLRAEILGDGWLQSADVAWSLAGDHTGLHILRASQRDGYAWAPVATLSVVGIETDRWIGNGCLATDGRTLAVVYGARGFTNDEQLMNRGGFAALVDLVDGSVTDLGRGFSLSYFNPGCGAAGAVTLSAFSDDFDRTRIDVVDAASKAIVASTETEGQVTSATMTGSGLVAAGGDALLSVGASGELTPIVGGKGVPYDIRVSLNGELTFLTQDDGHASVTRVDPTAAPPEAVVMAGGAADQVTLIQDATGRLFITGADEASAGALPDDVALTRAAPRSTPSSQGELLVAPAVVAATPIADPASVQSIELDARTSGTDRAITFSVQPVAQVLDQPVVRAESLHRGPYGTGSSTDPVDAERACAVPRNDPSNQALQPKPRQVEWAVGRAVKGTLTAARPANWKNLGMTAYTPQSLFPKPALSGGGTIPAQIVLGVLSQESNLWQASAHTTPGVTGNPLIGSFYGNDRFAGEDTFWDIDFADADCGYGVAQITDGMRLAGREGKHPRALPYAQQRAIALDYAANVAKAVQMLSEKWNQTRNAGLIINDGGSKYLENWFFAVWAYNTGFYPDARDGSPWGVGWLNNPANPAWDPSRGPFLDRSPGDAGTPQYWPYPEKVMGFAAHPIDLFEDADTAVQAFRPATWLATDGHDGEQNRFTVKPPINTFCKASNKCFPGTLQQPADPAEKPGPCLNKDTTGAYDLKCWYHGTASWKGDCDSQCGREFLRFDPPGDYPNEEADASSFRPNCSTEGLPPGSLVIDDVPNGTASKRPAYCPSVVASSGSFSFAFGSDPEGRFPSKMDLHQLGAGFNSHFYFAHTRTPGGDIDTYHDGSLNVTGTWRLGRSIDQWARVMVHMPDHGAWTQQAMYRVNLGDGTEKKRALLQRQGANSWVPLGVFHFTGTPEISLSNVTQDGVGADDVAWDAIAIQPLSAKPSDVVVSMGDSFSSGEGASSFDGADYSSESDTNGDDPQLRNACHRSNQSWSRKAAVGRSHASVGSRADSWDASLDYNFIACSGAQSENLLPASGPRNAANDKNAGQYHELSQMDRGFLDENTTLVTLSIGGNDAGFAAIIKECLQRYPSPLDCKASVPPGESEPLERITARRTSSEIPASVATVIQQIQVRAPRAIILLMGYPLLFETGSDCVLVKDSDRPWLNKVGADLSGALLAARNATNSAAHPVIFADPRSAFSGTNLCTPAGISSNTGLVFQFSPGDAPIFSSEGQPVSQQSFHPNTIGTDLYARVMMESLHNENFVFNRISDADRYSTSVAISKAAFPDSSAGASTVWIASGENFPDALSAGPAAATQNAPLLLTANGALPAAIKAELRRLHPSKIVLVGGASSVSTAVESELDAIAPTERVAGSDRYAASRAISRYAFGTNAPSVYVATGVDYPDAISAGAAAAGRRAPLLLVDGRDASVDTATRATLAVLKASTISVVGGTSSVSTGAQSSLDAIAPTTRLSGADRYAASLAVSTSVYSSASTVYVATGAGYTDALAGAALAARRKAPLFLVQPGCIPSGVIARVKSLGATSLTVIGGTKSVSEAATIPTVC